MHRSSTDKGVCFRGAHARACIFQSVFVRSVAVLTLFACRAGRRPRVSGSDEGTGSTARFRERRNFQATRHHRHHHRSTSARPARHAAPRATATACEDLRQRPVGMKRPVPHEPDPTCPQSTRTVRGSGLFWRPWQHSSLPCSFSLNPFDMDYQVDELMHVMAVSLWAEGSPSISFAWLARAEGAAGGLGQA